ncbi:glycoside hydrolase family 5 protein [Dipodascopsis tothii]|uniref:glycoside hydrolase family 5 protein n=1 Tax=Dipodascopsis tothii TaxID=44089 RepID=UPI0034CF8A1B
MTVPSILKTRGTLIVDGDGNKVLLKGAGLGGMLNMENFITGFAGHEKEHKEILVEAIGQDKVDFFFDKFYDYFWSDADAEFYASLGLNTLRVPVNYRHFMDDDNPSVIKAEGFRLLDRVVERCAKYGIYTIIDLHAAPGGQNQDWHSDSGSNLALFFEFKDFQDRVVQLWEAIAAHYKGNAWIAGYNPLNEPADPKHTRLWAFYVRVEKAIRAIDPDHILFLDGNTYAGDFSHFGEPLPNSVYAIHDYALFGFPGFEQFEGTAENHGKLQRQFDRKVKEPFALDIPVWNGEFGPVYESSANADAETINSKRYAMLNAQLGIYRKHNVGWSIWTYKDIGIQGLVCTSPDSPWNRLVAPFVAKKQAVGADFWGGKPDDAHDELLTALADDYARVIPAKYHKVYYPPLWDIKRQIARVSREIVLSHYLAYEFADLFKGKTLDELDELAASFKIENAVKRDALNEYLRADAALD